MNYEDVLTALTTSQLADERLLRGVMIQGIQLVHRVLPKVGKHAIGVAADFKKGKASEAELTKARVACWEYLEPKTYSNNSDVCAMRAVICALYPVIDEPFDFLSTFLDFAHQAGASDTDLTALLKRVYKS